MMSLGREGDIEDNFRLLLPMWCVRLAFYSSSFLFIYSEFTDYSKADLEVTLLVCLYTVPSRWRQQATSQILQKAAGTTRDNTVLYTTLTAAAYTEFESFAEHCPRALPTLLEADLFSNTERDRETTQVYFHLLILCVIGVILFSLSLVSLNCTPDQV